MIIRGFKTAKLIMAAIFLVFFCFAIGCNTYWYRQGNTFNECMTDQQDCLAELEKYYDLSHLGKPETDFVKNCMRQKGYRLVTENKLPPKIKRQDPIRSTYWFTYGVAGSLDE